MLETATPRRGFVVVQGGRTADAITPKRPKRARTSQPRTPSVAAKIQRLRRIRPGLAETVERVVDTLLAENDAEGV